MKLYNTLTRKIEEFVPLHPPDVTLYQCGPTVYNYAHIGNFRTYVMTDILVRTLRYFGYRVKFVTNVTDVGHLVSDSDTGEDKMEKGARREGKSAWDIAKFYTDAFLADSRKLNLVEPDVRPRPTEHIKEQIAMVSTLLEKGYAYKISDGIYFDTSKVKDYGRLAGPKARELLAGARVEENPEKRNPSDFALWKFSPSGQKRQMEWPSPWGTGFPGWHIECSAMSTKYLGPQLDIHTGGADLIPIHHTNEIAQSESASGVSPFVRYWIHGEFIQVNGEKMAKSRGNFYNLSDIEARGFHPLVLRYFYLTAHYRSFLNFTWDALTHAKNSLAELVSLAMSAETKKARSGRQQLSAEKDAAVVSFTDKFSAALSNDLNVPQALACVWEMLKSNIPSQDKVDLLRDFDEVLGLSLDDPSPDLVRSLGAGPLETVSVSDYPEVESLLAKRETLRREKNFSEADEIRKRIEALGFIIEDTPQGIVVKKRKSRD